MRVVARHACSVQASAAPPRAFRAPQGAGGGGGKRERKDDTWTDFRGKNVTWENLHERREGQTPSQPFEDYYKAQRVCPEAEWDAFMDVLQTPLPITFRINGSGKFSAELRRRFEVDFFSKISADSLGGNGGAHRALVPFLPACCGVGRRRGRDKRHALQVQRGMQYHNAMQTMSQRRLGARAPAALHVLACNNTTQCRIRGTKRPHNNLHPCPAPGTGGKESAQNDAAARH